MVKNVLTTIDELIISLKNYLIHLSKKFIPYFKI